jgi:hypothetical protein
VPSRGRDENAGGENVAAAVRVASALLVVPPSHHRRVGELLELCRDAKGQRLREDVAERMRVRVDEAGEQRLAARLDDGSAWRRVETLSKSCDASASYEHVTLAEHLHAVEDSRATDEDRAILSR